jgi:hypothetical protein
MSETGQSPKKQTPASGEPRTGRKASAAGRSRKPSPARVPLAVATIGGVAGMAVSALNGTFSLLAGTHSAQSPSSASASVSATARASSRTPVASAVPLPANPLMLGDDSTFIADINYPDGTKVAAGQGFIKKWEIKNIGNVPWVGRFLAPDGKVTGDCTYPLRVPVPTTYPGKPVIISVPVAVPDAPQVCLVTWKMVNAAGDLYFPNEEGIWFNVTIVAYPRTPGTAPQMPTARPGKAALATST